MNHFIPIPFFLIAIIILVVGEKTNFKTLKTIAKIVIAISVVAFAYYYAKYLGYDILEIVRSILF